MILNNQQTMSLIVQVRGWVTFWYILKFSGKSDEETLHHVATYMRYLPSVRSTWLDIDQVFFFLRLCTMCPPLNLLRAASRAIGSEVQLGSIYATLRATISTYVYHLRHCSTSVLKHS